MLSCFYRNGVLFHDVVYHDGGISDAIPVREAYRRGCRTIVVVRTVPSEYQYTTEWVDRMGKWFENSRLQRLWRWLKSISKPIPKHLNLFNRLQKMLLLSKSITTNDVTIECIRKSFKCIKS